MSIQDNRDLLTIEPKEYLAEFSYLKRSKIMAVVGGLIIAALSIILPNLFFRLVLIAGGLMIFVTGLKELINTEAKLKLAKTGLWTKKLGFKPWSSIKIITIKIHRYPVRSTPKNSLKIYLIDNKTIWPDQELYFNALKNNDRIKPIIDELCGKNLKCEEIIS